MIKQSLILAFLMVQLTSTGCVSTSTLYHWGSYERLLYSMYSEPGSADATTQIQALTTDIQKAHDMGKKVAPGIHAHLGMMYASQGKVEQALAAFNMEKVLYPESLVLIEGMMMRAGMFEGFK